MAQVIAADLAAAGIAVRDDAGRVIDFHALRHTFITRLARSGVTPKVAQTLARHSTITLTMDRYAHVALADTSKALDALPALPLANVVANEAAVAATGTHGREVAQRAGSVARSAHGPTSPNRAGTGPTSALRIAPNGLAKSQRPQQRAEGNPGHSASSPANDTSAAKRTAAASEGRRNSRKRRDLCAPGQPVSSAANAEVSSEADGTRTRNHRIDSRRGECPNSRQNADLRDIPTAPAAPGAAPAAESPLPPDLAAVVAAWPALPPAVRAGIAAMVQAAANAR